MLTSSHTQGGGGGREGKGKCRPEGAGLKAQA